MLYAQQDIKIQGIVYSAAVDMLLMQPLKLSGLATIKSTSHHELFCQRGTSAACIAARRDTDRLFKMMYLMLYAAVNISEV